MSVAVDIPYSGWRIEKQSYLDAQLSRLKKVVGGDHGEEGSPHQACGNSQSGHHSSVVSVLYDDDGQGVRLSPSEGHFRGIVPGCIIDQDDLEVRAVLCRNAVKGTVQVASLVEADDDDGYQWRVKTATVKEDAELSLRLDHICPALAYARRLCKVASAMRKLSSVS
jgi:hypothetical protein